jgi:phosphoribosyl 1,2-cyclic phosphodiesterase
VAALAGFGHATADYAVALGRRADVRQVMLAHHKPDRTDPELDVLAVRLATADPRVVVAAEGETLDL